MKENILVVDLDNTLIKIDLFQEKLLSLLVTNPILFIKAIALLFKRKTLSKEFIADKTIINSKYLPINKKVLSLIHDYRKKGYKIILATGCSEKYIESIKMHIYNFDTCLSSNKIENCVGNNKLKKIKKLIGENSAFIYIGDSQKDIVIWEHCKQAIITGNDTKKLIKILKNKNIKILNVVKSDNNFSISLLEQMRVHQWSKNLLLFFPAIFNRSLLHGDNLLLIILSFFSFCLIASSVYIMNDVVDIEKDRAHPSKKNRPIASGKISLINAYFLMSLCLLSSFLIASFVSTKLSLLLLIYLITNILYSFYFKRIMVLDILFLTFFYTLRLIAGNIQFDVPLSEWIISFSLFLFFSLGILKRYADLILLENNNNEKYLMSGLVYRSSDIPILTSLGVSSGLVSTLIIFLYIGDVSTIQLYKFPYILNALAPLFLFWISRLWILGVRGQIPSDPVKFTLRDPITYFLLFFSILILLLAG
tara:strand:+ start:119 stop:1552 length:1434 start_codon:yes stop_codon:yes gene_type:complete